MNKPHPKKGFTLLELVFVIVIISILASAAMPRYFKTVEYARGMEAIINLGALHRAVQRYYAANRTYASVTTTGLDIDNPSLTPRNHFTYSVISDPSSYTITASRNFFEGGDGASTISIDQDGHISGTLAYQHVNF